MRANKEASDLEYWLKSKEYWTAKADEYFLATAGKGLTADDVRFFEGQEAKACEMCWRADLKHQEAQGLILVFTGRAKPRWT